MQHTLTAPPTGSREFGSTPAFNVLIAYEDFATGEHAKKTYDFLADQLGPDCHCANQMWKFGVLNIPKLREMAAQEARAADIIMFSGSGDDLPQHVKSWIEDWLPYPHNAIALVALSPPERSAIRSWPARAYLAAVARRGGLEFFAQPDLWPGRLLTKTLTLTGAEQDQRALAGLMNAVQPDTAFPRWGINE